MFTEAKFTVPWDLSDTKTLRSNFVSKSFYVVIDGVRIEAVRSAARLIKESFEKSDGAKVRGPLCLPTERRRYMILREVPSEGKRGMFIPGPKRIRNVLLIIRPSAIGVAAMISLTLPNSVNVKIEPYESQYELKEPK